MSLFCCLGYIVGLVLIYKALDWLIRRLYIGKYAERYILITGCDTGFGNILAKRLDKLGCHVFAGCLTDSGAAELKGQSSANLQVVKLDVTNEKSVRNAYDVIKAAIPEGKGLWGVMNNAGHAGTMGRLEWLTIANYRAVAEINLYGLIDVTKTFLPLVKIARGRVVNTASVFGRHTLENVIPYCISKYGVEAFTDGLRRSVRLWGVKGILIEPGLHKTRMPTQKNLGSLTEEAWVQATQEEKDEYGEEYFQYLKNTALTKFEAICSERLDDVVDAYHHALLGLFPRARYMPGKDAKFIWLPLQWLPEWLGDWLLTKLDTEQPLPAALKKKEKEQ